MNEQIEELLKQSTHDVMGVKQVDQKQFAELLVKECIKKIENEAEAYTEPTWAYEIINDIKEHFGVEE